MYKFSGMIFRLIKRLSEIIRNNTAIIGDIYRVIGPGSDKSQLTVSQLQTLEPVLRFLSVSIITIFNRYI